MCTVSTLKARRVLSQIQKMAGLKVNLELLESKAGDALSIALNIVVLASKKQNFQLKWKEILFFPFLSKVSVSHTIFPSIMCCLFILTLFQYD